MQFSMLNCMVAPAGKFCDSVHAMLEFFRFQLRDVIMNPRQHRLTQWQSVFLDTVAIWAALSILLSLFGTSPTWSMGVSFFICAFLASTMLYLNQGNLLTDEEVLAILRDEPGLA